jgi:Flagellar biosynthesis protein, FliO
MEFLNQNMQVITAAAAVLVLLLIVFLAWRAFSPRVAGRRGQRLGISEYYEIDKSRRLVLVRRDNVEHLILIGGGEDLVIEPGITASSIAAAYTPAPVAPDPATFRAPRAPIFAERKAAGGRGDPEL